MKHLGLLLVLASCAETIGPPPDDDPDAGHVVADKKVSTTLNADGSSTSVIDSTAVDRWTYADLDAFEEVDATGAWDLRFQRFHISTGEGTEVAPITTQTFDEVTAPPTAGWIADADTDADGELDFAFDQDPGWYDYDIDAHVLTPKSTVWAVRTSTVTIKLRIDEYYDAAGTAGVFTVTWRKL